MNKSITLLLALLCSFTFYAQDYFPKNDGVKTKNTNYKALTNAKIYVSHNNVINNATLLIRDGKVVASGKSVTIPKNSTIIDLKGKTIYPSFIDVYADFGVKKPTRADGNGRSSQYNSNRTGYYWNDHVMPENKAIDYFNYDEKKATEFLKAGFGTVNAHIQDGIVRGTGTLVALNNKGDNANRVLNDQSVQYLSFSKSVTSRQSYPSSIMGSMALLRQLYIDADWYAKGHVETTDLSLEALNKNKKQPQIFAAGSRLNALRADKVGDESGVQYVLVGGGDEYERINEIKNTNATFILPLKFPDAYNVENPFMASQLSLSDMRQWNQKPANAKILAENDVPFTFTTNGLKSPKEFMGNLKKAIAHGLPKEKALEALTTIPATILGQAEYLGNLNQGAWANFMIVSGDIFEDDATIYEHWIQGDALVFSEKDRLDIRGDYTFKLADEDYSMSVKGSLEKLKADVKTDDLKRGSKLSYNNDWVTLSITSKDTTNQEFIRVVANVDASKNLKGEATLPNGTTVPFYAAYKSVEAKEKDKKEKDKEEKVIVPVTFPNNAYGFNTLPEQETILFKNATVWTNEADGILKQTDVLIKDGKISKIGKNLSAGRATVVDATGKHLTSGIVDEHSHIAASSINEGGQNSSAEVSIEDVLNPSDINIYRNLAGGVTSIQILHGSANPIGGRSAIIKLKWGETADNLIYKDTPKFIKFALGENVKQSNWGSRDRFPQTRMGVEQVYMDYFTRAKEYDALKKSGKPYRKDIELEVLAEILNKERFISCHSYVQSEINMLMKVAERFNFNINTFTHILEGYKVADKMKAHGVGGSTFSDWWAYKFEVNDAIPYNAAIMHNQGITVAINSDDAEMSRRLNQEAAKAIKYGGVSEEEAWKFVTLNPAKLLHIDDRVGSIKVGKDADVVLWSHHPLSVYAKAEKTLIEGAVYFDIENDKRKRDAIKKEKSELINMMMQAKNKGLKTQPVKKEEQQHFHCDTMDNHF
ncbi:amidohydrolase family protein [Mangrovimonas spongiae]|uniref:Amidohydrolase n=1 Tax=Mangrovimonas spongiae TaxID=2494697 RepID=A0A428JYN5_9FLAO|nr:amidohydrolase family protein [Mangrovimonas spongiae]RSK39255.1 amidohydrolase [Mangrovimonas spongiae]